MMTDDFEAPSLRQLLTTLSRDLVLLLTQTAALARLELQSARRTLMLSLAGLALGIVVAIAGLAVLIAALVLIAIALGLSPWGAASLVGGLLTAIGAGIAYTCVLRIKRAPLRLPDTRQSVRETVAWVKAQATK